jgi:predicted neuraminidase
MDRIKLLSKQPVFESSAGLFSKCHCSTLVKNEDGDMLVSYFAGAREGSLDQGIWLSRRISGKWEAPRRIKYMYGFIHWNPLLHYEDGCTYLFYKVGMTVAGWYTMVSVSYDFGETWSESKELVDGDHTPRGSSKNKLFVKPDGTWLGPCSVETEKYWDCFIDISKDKGKTWVKHPINIEHYDPVHSGKLEWAGVNDLWLSDPDTILKWDGIIQPTIWQSGENNFHALMRSTRGFIYRSDSKDGGETWSTAYPTRLPNNNCGIDLAQLEDGTLALVYNPISANWGKRSPLSISLSNDNGETWSEPWHLETGEKEYSYPAVIANGMNLDVVYTYGREKIMHCNIMIQKNK